MKTEIQFKCTMSSYYKLKVNARSIAEEARIIRSTEQKMKAKRRKVSADKRLPYSSTFGSLQWHRTSYLRGIAKITHLTLAYLHGKTYKQCESNPKETVCAYQLQKKWDKFGVKGDAAAWVKGDS